MSADWGRAYKKKGSLFLARYEKSKEAVRDAYLGRILGLSETIGIVNLTTGREWVGNDLERLLEDYERFRRIQETKFHEGTET